MLFIKALWDKIQNYVIISAFVYGGIMTTLYYHSHTELKAATIKVQSLTEGLKGCEEGRVKSDKSESVTNDVTLAQIGKLEELEQEKDSLLQQLANIPRKDCNNTNESKTQDVKDEEIDIDARLPNDDIIRLLEQSYRNYERKGSSSSRSSVE